MAKSAPKAKTSFMQAVNKVCNTSGAQAFAKAGSDAFNITALALGSMLVGVTLATGTLAQTLTP